MDTLSLSGGKLLRPGNGLCQGSKGKLDWCAGAKGVGVAGVEQERGGVADKVRELIGIQSPWSFEGL